MKNNKKGKVTQTRFEGNRSPGRRRFPFTTLDHENEPSERRVRLRRMDLIFIRFAFLSIFAGRNRNYCLGFALRIVCTEQQILFFSPVRPTDFKTNKCVKGSLFRDKFFFPNVQTILDKNISPVKKAKHGQNYF